MVVDELLSLEMQFGHMHSLNVPTYVRVVRFLRKVAREKGALIRLNFLDSNCVDHDEVGVSAFADSPKSFD
jgi:hypothetical protein